MAGFITLEDAKAHLRVDGNTDDVSIQALIDAASRRIERMTGFVAVMREETFLFDYFASELELRLRPVQLSTIAVVYLDGTGIERTFSDIRAVEKNGTVRVLPAAGARWPTSVIGIGAVQVTAMVGYPADSVASQAPDTIKHAARLCVAAWYDDREDGRLPPAVGMLLDCERAWRV